MSISKRALLNVGHGLRRATRPVYLLSQTKYVACFSTMSDINNGPITPDKLSNKDSAVEGSESGSGISNDTQNDVERSQGGHGGSGIPNLKHNKGGSTRSDKDDNVRERRRTDDYMDMGDATRDTAGSVVDVAKAGVVGAMETGLKFGEMAKQTMDGMWNATKQTTENIRDSVADDHGDSGDHRHGGQPTKSDDKHMEDLKRWTRGADLKH